MDDSIACEAVESGSLPELHPKKYYLNNIRKNFGFLVQLNKITGDMEWFLPAQGVVLKTTIRVRARGIDTSLLRNGK